MNVFDIKISEKACVLSVLAMVSIVLIHSTTVLTVAEPAFWNTFCQYLITRSFTYWSVPFFFCMSGYWFSKSAYVMNSGESIGSFWKKKTITLLIPFFLWCIIGCACVTPLVVANNFFTGRDLFLRTVFEGSFWAEGIVSLFGLKDICPIGNGPLWYVRSLILLFILAPLFKLVINGRFGWIILLILGLVETLIYPMDVPYINLPSSAIGWFSIGCVISCTGVERLPVAKSLLVLSGCGWVLVSIIKALKSSSVCILPDFVFQKLFQLLPYFGIVFIWGIYDCVYTRLKWLQRYSGMTFFIYVFHSISIAYFIAIVNFIFGKSDIVNFINSLSCGLFALIFSYGIGKLVKNKFPTIAKITFGGR